MLTGDTPSADQIKREFSKARLLALAQDEGLEQSREGRLQCPMRCSEDLRGASVSDAEGYALYHCQRCDHGGSAIDLVMATRSLDLPQAMQYLRERLPHLTSVAAPRKSAGKSRPTAAALWSALATADTQGLAYLKSRGLEAATAHVRFNAGGTGYGWLDHRSVDGFRLAMPLWSCRGELEQLHLRNIFPDDQIPLREDTKKPWASKIQLPGANPPDGLVLGNVGRARTADKVFLAEGMADTLALLVAGVVVVGAPGVDQVKKLPAFLGDVVGRTVVVCRQNDAPRVAAGAKVRLTSEQAFVELEQQLQAAGAVVLHLLTPAPHKDPAEWHAALGSEAFKAELDKLNAAPEELQPQAFGTSASGNTALKVLALPRVDPRPRIIVRTDEHEVNDAAVAALAGDDVVYQRDGILVHVARDASTSSGSDKPVVRRETNAPRIAPLPPPVLRERLAARARWVKVLKKKGNVVPEHPPTWCVSAVHARANWPGVRWLSGVVESPVLRGDGSILDVPGYDRESGLLFEPSGPFLPVSDAPSKAEAIAAAEELLGLVADFPFKTMTHMSAWLAALLTPLARAAFDGPAPLFLIDSNTRGSGKGLLADVASVIVSGRGTPRMAGTDREEEWRKRIMAIAIAGDPVVLIDNLPGVLGSAALDMALTAGTISDRVLGVSENATVRIKAIWMATGNNVLLKGDLLRRTIHIRLESKDEKPEERAGFRHPELLSHVRQQRPQLLKAALTILRGYFTAGRPDQNLTPLGSFEAWSRLIRHAVVWLGFDDPSNTRASLGQAADTEHNLLAQLLSAWEEFAGDKAFTLREILRGFEKEAELSRLMKQASKQPPLYDVFSEISPAQGGVFNAKTIGRCLMKYRGRVVNGKRLESREDRHRTLEWSLVYDSAGFAGYAGSICSPTRVNFPEGPKNQRSLFMDGLQTKPANPANPAPQESAHSGDQSPLNVVDTSAPNSAAPTNNQSRGDL